MIYNNFQWTSYNKLSVNNIKILWILTRKQFPSPYLIKDIKNVCLSYGNFILRAYNRDSSEVAEIGDKFHALLKELIGLNLEMNFLASYPRTNYL